MRAWIVTLILIYMGVKQIFTKESQAKIVGAITAAELQTSGEIRVHIEAKCATENVLDRAVDVFYTLGMDKTNLKNGVLIYLAHKSGQFAIIGDKGINECVPSNFWDEIKHQMREDFVKGEFVKGLCSAIISAGDALKKYFPYQEDDINEQPNEISFGDEK